jgi:hypothetical protein
VDLSNTGRDEIATVIELTVDGDAVAISPLDIVMRNTPFSLRRQSFAATK